MKIGTSIRQTYPVTKLGIVKDLRENDVFQVEWADGRTDWFNWNSTLTEEVLFPQIKICQIAAVDIERHTFDKSAFAYTKSKFEVELIFPNGSCDLGQFDSDSECFEAVSKWLQDNLKKCNARYPYDRHGHNTLFPIESDVSLIHYRKVT
jgi:hypothetical protein